MRDAVTRQTELCHATRYQQTWVRRTVRRMTGDAPVGLNRRMFINKRALLVCVTLDASGIGSDGKSGLLEFKTAVRIVAIAALHRPFQNLVMEGQIELVLGFTVATETELWFTRFQQTQIREARLLRVRSRYEHIRGCQLPARFARVA